MHTNRWKNIHAYLFEPEKRLQTSLCTWSRLVNPAHHITTHLSFWRTENKVFIFKNMSELMKLHNRRAFFPKIFWETILPDPLQANSLASCVYFTFSTSCIGRGYLWKLQIFWPALTAMFQRVNHAMFYWLSQQYTISFTESVSVTYDQN